MAKMSGSAVVRRKADGTVVDRLHVGEAEHRLAEREKVAQRAAEREAAKVAAAEARKAKRALIAEINAKIKAASVAAPPVEVAPEPAAPAPPKAEPPKSSIARILVPVRAADGSTTYVSTLARVVAAPVDPEQAAAEEGRDEAERVLRAKNKAVREATGGDYKPYSGTPNNRLAKTPTTKTPMRTRARDDSAGWVQNSMRSGRGAPRRDSLFR